MQSRNMRLAQQWLHSFSLRHPSFKKVFTTCYLIVIFCILSSRQSLLICFDNWRYRSTVFPARVTISLSKRLSYSQCENRFISELFYADD